jgi:hypothetical protein
MDSIARSLFVIFVLLSEYFCTLFGNSSEKRLIISDKVRLFSGVPLIVSIIIILSYFQGPASPSHTIDWCSYPALPGLELQITQTHQPPN